MFLALPVGAEPLRLGLFHTDLSRKGPGLLLRDIQSGRDAQVRAVASVIAGAAVDIVVLLDVDWDYDLRTATALRDVIGAAHYPHIFSRRPNTGMPTGLDLDGDGRFGRAADAQGFGEFSGQGGMVILSRYPVLNDDVLDFSDVLWRDFPGAITPDLGAAAGVQRLSSTGHWAVPFDVNGTVFWIMAFHATPPVFDGPEDRNGLRNRDELRFFGEMLEGPLKHLNGAPAAIMGGANMDPTKGEGRRDGIEALLNTPGFHDVGPAAVTVDWPDVADGQRRVDYILPAAHLGLRATGVIATEAAKTASRHRFVWVEVELPPIPVK